MGTELVPETSEHFHTLTRLLLPEKTSLNFVAAKASKHTTMIHSILKMEKVKLTLKQATKAQRGSIVT